VFCVEYAFTLGVGVILLRELGIVIKLFLDVFFWELSLMAIKSFVC
jgi:hypothetical protein